MKLLISLLYPIFILVIMGGILYHQRMHKHFKWFVFLNGIFAFALLVFTYFYFKFEDTIYFWDSSGQWSNAIYTLDAYHYSLDGLFYELYQSMLHTEYSKLPAFFLLFPLHQFGTEFRHFAFAMVLVFAIPACFLLTAFVYQYHHEKMSKWHLVSLVSLVYLSSPILFSMLEGESGAAGIVFILLFYWLFASYRYERFELLKNIALVGCILILVFLRRWYIFWVISYFFTTFLFQSYVAYRKKKFPLWLIVNYAFITFTVLVCLWLFFKEFVIMITTANYVDAYVAYRISLLNQLQHTLGFYGLGYLVLVIIGIYWIYKSKSKYGFLPFHIVFTYATFLIVDRFDTHHYYVITIELLLLIIIAILRMDKKWQHLLISVVIGFVFLTKLVLPFPNLLAGTITNAPEVRKDKEDIIAMVKDMNQIVQDDSIYILASSLLYNNQTFQNVMLPQKMSSMKNMLAVAHIDQRDGFPLVVFDADYILLVSPHQIHKEAKYQKVIIKLSEALQTMEKDHYQLVKTYKIDETSFTLVKKIKEFTLQQQQSIIDFVEIEPILK